MAYTISDVQETYADRIRLIAGAGGLARPVRETGILDYELMPGVKQRFQKVNFYEGQLVLSTFLYAKDDPYLITEAIKYLVSKGSSGLIIKNVFHLQIPDGAIRYANARNFPLFVTTSDRFLFDEVITHIDRTLQQMGSVSRLQRELDELLAEHNDPERVLAHARTLNPSLQSEHRALYVLMPEGLEGENNSADQHFSLLEQRFLQTELASYTNLLAPYEDGLLLIVSGDRMVGAGGLHDADRIACLLKAEVLDSEASAVGIGDTHFELDELPEAIIEAVRAARFAAQQEGGLVRYGDLGAYRLILAHLDSPAFRAFEHDILEPLRSSDAECGSHLLETLRCYCANGQNFTQAAEALGQHENTVRRRLERIAVLTGLSFREADQMEQLSLACKIERCQEIMS